MVERRRPRGRIPAARVVGLACVMLSACAGPSADRPSARIPEPEAIAPAWVAAPLAAAPQDGLAASGCTQASNLLAFDRTKAVAAATRALTAAAQRGADALGVEATVGRQDLMAAVTQEVVEVESAQANQVCALIVLAPEDVAVLVTALAGGPQADISAFLAAARAQPQGLRDGAAGGGAP